MMQIERALQAEIVWRLKPYPIVAVSIPNGVHIPSRDPAERDIAARIIKRMKTDGQFTPGAADMVLIGPKGGLYLELKRPRTHDLFTVRPKGQLSPEQKEFRAQCERAGVRYVVATCWAEVESSLGGLF
jgi:hypothetical protein